ncbi:tRNA lysidine(34) synthetase TilS [Sphingomonas sp. BK580]|uniref:tRNA lysidine(34) synthetase TilS n=1 Tax=Sphingomonas sp. BK580 TaxID=2586972 RepID=UPI00161A30CB|nr:tRNA lysidine(34) synthetase TilS [Sphingomonas sp. BK580]MBB3694087.1 tRNA(Ile)-lysidine synthase [Sphingomonas sp. BK580]
MTPLPAAAVARFGDDLRRGLARAHGVAAVERVGRVGVAVSGGPDSVALLLLAAAARPGEVVAATVDHRLRPAGADEAAMVSALCERLRVPHATLVPATPIVGSSLQRRAREARYAALTGWAARERVDALLTAHHADDQAETLLMRLNRASGLTGLSAIRAARREGATLLLRPLLAWRRAELRALVEASGAPFVDDPSNADPRHDRTRVRAALAATPALDPAALAAAAGYLAEAEEVIARQADSLWAARWHGPDRPLAIADEPRELRRRLLRRALHAIRAERAIARPAFTDSSNIEPLLDALEARRGAVHAGIKVEVRAYGWIFHVAPPRRSL